ncbi:MAG TPA: TraR/DksA C4-type zinc finger protein [Mycobacteriales bacterium]|nr:TraR/DksA C4-type zinc finger protein [Mycobacteriales bacterium]
MTSTIQYDLDMLRQTLEERYESHTNQLTALAAGSGGSDFDEESRSALITSSRQAISEIAHALRRMAQGTYGRCERCEGDIPAERLEVLPHTRHCTSCQAALR